MKYSSWVQAQTVLDRQDRSETHQVKQTGDRSFEIVARTEAPEIRDAAIAARQQQDREVAVLADQQIVSLMTALCADLDGTSFQSLADEGRAIVEEMTR